MKPHYARIRRVLTTSGATAVQVGTYHGKRFILHKHIGSAKEPEAIATLLDAAVAYIETHAPQLSFDFRPQSRKDILYTRGIRVHQSKLTTAYEYFTDVYRRVGFHTVDTDVLKHFVLMRVLEPASKIKSLYLLRKYFGVVYAKTTAFRQLSQSLPLKERAIAAAIVYTKKHLGFDFSLVFYDVTTLYFETHRGDDFRANGFSKDNKVGQPQILVGLMVNHTGFPVYYDLFPGNTFEGHTMIPVIAAIREKYRIKNLTVVADAGMLNQDNLSALEERGIDYVVGARIKTLPLPRVREIAATLGKQDGAIIRLDDILYEYSAVRARKDKADNDAALEKATYLLRRPGRLFKRSPFLSVSAAKRLTVNAEAVEKYRLLEGIKGYKTNVTDVADHVLITRYKDLWHVEQSFRIAKSDLAARPIYHRKKESIEYHLLIVFMALCLTKVIEQEKHASIQKVTESLKDIWTVMLKDEISGNSTEVTINTKPH